MLVSLANRGLGVEVYTTEARPDETGKIVIEKCKALNLVHHSILDSAVAAFMPEIDCVMIGCEAVLGNGGIVNKIGTFQVALIAQHFQKPVYVFCESYKFMQYFPLGQDDVLDMLEGIESKSKKINKEDMRVDYTPPQHLDLFFTDKGIFTTSSISD
jgi:translation initiation factor eIF-2B subunit alpha